MSNLHCTKFWTKHIRITLTIGLWLWDCTANGSWNNPYPTQDAVANVVYASFSERPKHLDPVRSYSANEYAFIAQIYQPPLQYHFLKRPAQLIPQTLEEFPIVTLLDAAGQPLPAHTPVASVAFSDYLLRIRPGIYYQPHPALAQNSNGRYLYHNLTPEQIAAINTIADFPKTGSREVTAADYAYQITRMAWPRQHCPITAILSEYILGFKNASDTLEKVVASHNENTNQNTPYLDLRAFNIAGVQVINRYQLRIRLKGRYPQFLYWMAMPFFAPMPWEADKFYSQSGMNQRNINLDWYPIGSGPFMLTENNPNLRMVLMRNPNFRGETYPDAGEPTDAAAGLLADAGRSLPFIDGAIYSLEREDIPYWNKFLQGFYDVSGITSDSFDQAVRFNDQGEAGLADTMRQRGIKLDTAVETSIFFLGFNMLDPIVGGKSERARLLRQAIAIAINFEEFISIFANGRGISAQGPIPPGIFGNHPAEYNKYVYNQIDGRLQRKSITAAASLLAQAGFANGRDQITGQPLIINYDTTASGADDKARLSWMLKQFQQLGIQLVIRATDYNRFQEKMRKGDAQLYMWGWNADYPDPENFLFLLYGPNSKVTYGGENTSNYDNPEFNSLFEQMKAMDNTPERQLIIDRMVEILHHDAPWAGGFHPKSFALRHEWIHNVKPNPMANNTLKYRRVDPLLRAQKRTKWNQPITWPLWTLGILSLLMLLPAYLSYKKRELHSARS